MSRSPIPQCWYKSCLTAMALAAGLLSGCCGQHKNLQQALMQQPTPEVAAREYRVGCPDVLMVQIDGYPEWSGRREVQVNGCIDFSGIGGVRVEGRTTGQIEEYIATTLGLDVRSVHVVVSEYRSQQIYLFGEVSGEQRAVAYQGPETVVDLLRRVGGITEDGAPAGVRVVRPALLDAGEPQTFQVNLQAILMEGDTKTNLNLQPYDQIYVPETTQAKVGKCLHPGIRALAKMIFGSS